MTIQIAVRLPDELVAFVDTLVREGDGSRAAVVTRALHVLQRQCEAERDAVILEREGDYDDFDALVRHASLGD